jgi:recombination endonuclease VII
MTLDDYAELLAKQGGGCGICGTSADLVVDHDHDTGRTRGLLCRPHNAAIGQLGDDPALLLKAAAWIRGELSYV